MDYIKAFTYGWDSRRGDFRKPEAKHSLKVMKERTAINYCIISIAALQDTAQSIEIDHTGEHMVADDELVEMIEYAKSLDLKVILKPTVNVRNGTWRAHINFFDIDVPCEPKWSEWFASYTAYQCHYARIAEQTQCDMLIVGCEMVQSDRREAEWRQLIKDVRQFYSGLISYNADKYQEGNVKWWDAVDVISSSGYYPIDDWDQQLARIEQAIAPYHKPFFFAEAGCPSRKGAAMIPNDWTRQEEVDLEEQANFYRVMFEKTKDKHWVQGYGLWDWSTFLPAGDSQLDDGYGVYNKPAEQVIKQFFST